MSVIPAAGHGHAGYVEAVLDRTDIDVGPGLDGAAGGGAAGDGGPDDQRVVRAHGADAHRAGGDGARRGPWRQAEVADVLRAAGAR